MLSVARHSFSGRFLTHPSAIWHGDGLGMGAAAAGATTPMMADRNGLHGDAVVLAEGDRLVVDAMRKHPTHHKLQQVTTLTTFSTLAA